MKKLFLATAIMIAGMAAYAQVPQKMNYQGIARDNTGKALASKTISMRISILDGSTAEYVETHSGVTTNQFGLYNAQIGAGAATTGTFSGITWGTGTKNIKVEIDPNGGSSYSDMGTTQLLSVPYALYSANGTPGPAGPAGPAGAAGATGPAGPAGSANINGTTGYLVKFNAATTGNNSAIFQNATSGWLGVGTTSPIATLNLAVPDSAVIRATSTYSGQVTQGIIRAEYTGSTDANHGGVLGVAVPNLSGTNGVGVFGVGGFIGVDGRGISSATGSTTNNVGVRGTGYLDGGTAYGVIGIATAYSTSGGTKYGVYGNAANGTTNYAGYFVGNTHVNGVLSKSSGTFKIDHPLDPENKYLVHSFVESPDMMNVYNGNITTNANGEAVVALPAYFETLNKDFRYQLTVIGTFAQAIVAQKVQGNKFVIKTNQPNVEVSWQVTGIRQDAFAKAHPVVAEVEKEEENKGKFLNPVELGRPADSQIGLYKMDSAKELPTPVAAGK